MHKETLKNIIAQNSEIMDILNIIKSLNLADSWLCAGTIRNYFWDYLSNTTHHVTDVDVVFFDPKISYEKTLELEKTLKKSFPMYPWELKNECYMHIHNPQATPYTSTYDAISKFPEKCTAIGVRLDSHNEIELLAPFGIDDIARLIVAPTPFFAENDERMAVYRKRLQTKRWQEKWPELKILGMEDEKNAGANHFRNKSLEA